MPRKSDSTVIDIHVSRANWYQAHFSRRQFALAHPARERASVARACQHIRPTLTIYGGECLPKCQEDEIIDIGIGLKIESWFVGWWYWSDEGWREFERLWAELPEPVHTPLCTNRILVHSSYTRQPANVLK